MVLVALVALVQCSGRPHAVTIALGAPKAATDLPDMPAEWKGKIDYRRLDRQMAELAQRPEMAGLAVAIVEGGTLRFVGTYGTTDRTRGTPVTPFTQFRWASVSKTVTGVLAAKLAHEGRLDLDQPVSSWPTSLRLPGGAERRVTLDQLLSQRTGLTKNAYDEKLEEGQNPAALRRALAGAPLQCEPGTCHSYQNVAFDTAREIFGQVLGEPMTTEVEAHLFRPLGMVSARYGMAGLTGAKQWAHPHRKGQPVELKEAYWRVPAAAGVESNIIDLSLWMQAMMGERPDILPAPLLKLAHTPRVATPPLYGGALRRATSDPTYALGWRSFVYDGRRLEGHSGAVAGYRATMVFDPQTRTGIVALWNSEWGVPFRIPFAALDSYFGKGDTGWLDLSSIPADPGDGGPPLPPASAPGG